MKKIVKFYAGLMTVIAIFLLYGHVIFPLLTEANTMANIFGWILMPIPITCLWYVIKSLYPLTLQKIKEGWEIYF